jgi:HK97 family phage major capsid protein
VARTTIDTDALKRERGRLLDEAGNILSAANDADRPLEPDEQRKYDDLMKDADKKRRQIQTEEEMRMAEGLTDPNGRPAHKPGPPVDAPNYAGLGNDDVQRFSIRRLIAAKAGIISPKEADFELQVDEYVAKRSGKGQGGLNGQAVAHIPFEVMHAQKRDLSVATESADIVEVEHGGVIELLRNRMVTRAAGVRVLTGLRGDLLLPKHTAATTNTAWVTEGNAPSEGTPTFGQVKFSPSQLACYMDVTRQTLLQGSFDVEQFLRMDLATNLAIEIDRTVLHGSGSGAEPAGVFNTSSIGDVAGGTNGAAPTWPHIVELETDVAVANADLGSLAYITNAKVRGKLKTTERVSSTGLFVWQDPANLAPATPGTPLNGYRAFVTNQVRSDLTKGSVSTCSAIFFGNWEEGIVAIWSDLDILVDPYTGGSAGIVRMVALAFADFQVRHPESFSVMKDATT